MLSAAAACIVICVRLCRVTSEAFISLDDSRMSNMLSTRMPPSNTTDNHAHLLRRGPGTTFFPFIVGSFNLVNG